MTQEEDVVEVVRRGPVLAALAEKPLERAELEERLGMSRSTSHRCTRALKELDLVRTRDDGRIALTSLGELVAGEVNAFRAGVHASLRLGPVLDAVAKTAPAFHPRAFADATVTSAEDGDPFDPFNRFIALARESTTLRGCDLICIAPLYVPELLKRVLDGMRVEDVTIPAAVTDTLAHHASECFAACASGNVTVRLRHAVPFSLAIFDERVGVGVREPGGRRLRAFLDTDAPAAREWAEAAYESFRAGTVRLPEFSERGLREAVAAL